MKRVLITGSRHWTDESTIRRALAAITQFHGHELIIVHGDCPTGADALADKIAKGWSGMTVEPHPADWSLGKKAGPLRNQEMVDLGADICLAFPMPDSRGTIDCINRARSAGIKVVIYDGRE